MKRIITTCLTEEEYQQAIELGYGYEGGNKRKWADALRQGILINQ